MADRPLYESDCDRLLAVQRPIATAVGPWAVKLVEANYAQCRAKAFPGSPPEGDIPPAEEPCRHIEILLGLDDDRLPGGWSTLPIEIRRGVAAQCRAQCAGASLGVRGAIGCSDAVLAAVAGVLDDQPSAPVSAGRAAVDALVDRLNTWSGGLTPTAPSSDAPPPPNSTTPNGQGVLVAAAVVGVVVTVGVLGLILAIRR